MPRKHADKDQSGGVAHIEIRRLANHRRHAHRVARKDDFHTADSQDLARQGEEAAAAATVHSRHSVRISPEHKNAAHKRRINGVPAELHSAQPVQAVHRTVRGGIH